MQRGSNEQGASSYALRAARSDRQSLGWTVFAVALPVRLA
jgi:hypothetical protein